VAAEPAPAPAPAPVEAEKPALPMASTGRAPNDPREVRRRRLEAERLQKEAEAAAAQVKEVVTENGEELEESKEPKPL